ncbi:hypothetical protein NU10_13030 [Flavobacterium dauae]|uniref:hypothetical protein n=1 Tax=Flavobacterium dauae TaxID=1563479 RepID=UPI00101B3964|nr:hypothetical protein [Flavobacterium dauae]WLD23613.1 hypothetical protein NU10_13030 [Flavobacterium dauae]
MFRILLICIVLSCCNSIGNLRNEKLVISKTQNIYVIDSFDKAGTTASLKQSFSNLKSSEIYKNSLSDIQVHKIKKLLKDIKGEKHHQRKLSNIEKGILFCDSINCYKIIITNNYLIDLTNNYQYELSHDTYQQLSNLLYIE